MAWKREFWTTMDDKCFRTKEAAAAHERLVKPRTDMATCQCGAVYDYNKSPFYCPNVECHRARQNRLRESLRPILALKREWLESKDKRGSGAWPWSPNDYEKWRMRIAKECRSWSESDAIDIEIESFERSIEDEDRIIATLTAPPADKPCL